MKWIQQQPTWQWSFLYYWDLLRSLVNRDLKILYKRSALGIGWTLINPLMELAVFVFIFQVVLSIQIPQYTSYVFTGLLVWTWFNRSLFEATGSIIQNGSLIRQPGFPIAILPIVTEITGLIHLVLALPILLIFLLVDGVQLTPLILLMPILQLIQFGLTTSLAYLLAALNVTFRDTQHTLGVLLNLLFYLTPIFYEDTGVPDQFQQLYSFNPMVPIITSYRNILMFGQQPEWIPLGLITVFILLFLPVGYRVFRDQSHRFVENL